MEGGARHGSQTTVGQMLLPSHPCLLIQRIARVRVGGTRGGKRQHRNEHALDAGKWHLHMEICVRVCVCVFVCVFLLNIFIFLEWFISCTLFTPGNWSFCEEWRTRTKTSHTRGRDYNLFKNRKYKRQKKWKHLKDKWTSSKCAYVCTT